MTIQVLVQARKELIDRTYEALRGVKSAVVHVYNSTSTIQRERVFNQDREGIKAIATQGAQWVMVGAKDCLDHLKNFNQKKEIADFDKAAEDLRLATRHLGMIVGKVDVEEILGSIFNDFCIGK